MHTLVRTTVTLAGAALVAACQPAAPAVSPSPSVPLRTTASSVPPAAAPLASVLAKRDPAGDAQRLAAARGGLRLQMQRANGTRTALIVAGVAALAIIVVVVAGSSGGSAY